MFLMPDAGPVHGAEAFLFSPPIRDEGGRVPIPKGTTTDVVSFEIATLKAQLTPLDLHLVLAGRAQLRGIDTMPIYDART